MRHIEQVIVVEGKNDTATLKRYFDCETIETGGTSLPEDVLERIRFAQKTAGVIIFTDPDSPGNRIRSEINREVPGCLNAFIDKKAARTEKKVGVEHAGEEALVDALAHVTAFTEMPEQALSMQDFLDFGLCGAENSGLRREELGKHFHLGMGNAKTMLNRCNFQGITRKDLEDFYDKTH